MKDQPAKQRTAVVAFLGNVLLLLLGLTLALGLVELAMRAFPDWVPAEVRVNPPVRRVKAFVDQTYEIRLSDGDLFHYMQGKLAPLSPDQDEIVAQVHMITDANGFRNSPPEKPVYNVVAMGDSFTRASGVASAWPELLAEYTDGEVLNLADVGVGPQDELQVLQEYGLNKQPQWVILAYFEGNDLYDVASYEQANPFILLRFGRYMLDQIIDSQKNQEQPTETVTLPSSNYQYPISVTINNKDLPLAFFTYYVSWLSVDREALAASKNYRLAEDLILQMQALSEESDARFLLVYVPSKEHVYLPFLTDADLQTRVFTDVPTLKLDAAGFLQFTNVRATPELTLQNMDDQSDLLADFAADHNILFLDLTATFQEEAATGTELYYRFDTHWNQLGHDLAAGTISNFIEEILPIRP